MAKVLIVDDERSIRVTLAAFLRAEGFAVREAADAEIAERLLAEEDFDLVVTDIILPRVTGVELLKRLSRAAPDTPVIMMTGEPTVETAAESLRAGAFDYLAKPVTKETILRVVERARRFGALAAEKRRLEAENAEYRARLELLVAERSAQLAESEERLRAVFDSAPDYLLLLDRQHRVRMINRIESGLTVAEVLGRPLHELVEHADRDRVKGHLDVVVERGSRQQYDTSYLRPDGSVVYFSSIAAPVRVGGEITGTVVSSRDDTARRNLSAQLAQSDRLASMGMLAAGVAHEINNPLCYVLYGLESVADELPALVEGVSALRRQSGDRVAGAALQATAAARLDDTARRISDALSGTRRIRDIARGLGTFSRVERDEVAVVDPEAAADVAADMAFNEIKYRALLVKDYGGVAPVLASEGRLSQVFLNLLINAAHAIDEGSVDANRIQLRTWVEEGQVCAEVRDTGVGIPAERLGSLFEPFFTTKGVGRGTGLGLAISKNIVEGYGGTIDVESEVGVGTAFTVRLPVAAGRVESEAVDEARRVAPPRSRLLIVDDERTVRSALAHLFREHEIVAAASGMAARRILAEDQGFGAVLCDVMMSDGSGIELHQWLAAAHPALARRLVFVSGGPFTPRARDYLRGIDNHQLEKPFDVPRLRCVVEGVLHAAG